MSAKWNAYLRTESLSFSFGSKSVSNIRPFKILKSLKCYDISVPKTKSIIICRTLAKSSNSMLHAQLLLESANISSNDEAI